MSQYLPRYFPGDTTTIPVGSGGVVGGQLITWGGTTAGDASTAVVGVAGYDAAQGANVTIYREGIQIGTASGTLAVGDPICAAASGQVRRYVAGTDPVTAFIGRATAAAASGASVTYALFGV